MMTCVQGALSSCEFLLLSSQKKRRDNSGYAINLKASYNEPDTIEFGTLMQLNSL
jgi:hypothetical protein